LHTYHTHMHPHAHAYATLTRTHTHARAHTHAHTHTCTHTHTLPCSWSCVCWPTSLEMPSCAPLSRSWATTLLCTSVHSGRSAARTRCAHVQVALLPTCWQHWEVDQHCLTHSPSAPWHSILRHLMCLSLIPVPNPDP